MGCTYSALPESPFPGLSLSDLSLPAAAAAAAAAAVQFVLVGVADHDNDVDDDGGGGCFDVRSAITTPVLDGRWDENVLTHKHISCFSHTQRAGETEGSGVK